jgi:hypothetical protein
MKMMDNRAYQAKGINDSNDMVRRAGGDLGNDPRRVAAKVVMDTKIRDHDQSGYNHAYTPESDRFARQAENKAMGMGTPNPDGTYSK